MNGLDGSGQGILETYERKVSVISARYPGRDPKHIITKLLGADMGSDEA